MPSFIPDGYNFKAGIRPLEMVHDGLEFTYRPMTPNDAGSYHGEAEFRKGSDLRKLQADWMIKHTVGWSLPKSDVNPNGGECPPMTQEVLVNQLAPALFNSMFSIIIGWDSPDYGEDCSPKELAKNSKPASN